MTRRLDAHARNTHVVKKMVLLGRARMQHCDNHNRPRACAFRASEAFDVIRPSTASHSNPRRSRQRQGLDFSRDHRRRRCPEARKPSASLPLVCSSETPSLSLSLSPPLAAAPRPLPSRRPLPPPRGFRTIPKWRRLIAQLGYMGWGGGVNPATAGREGSGCTSCASSRPSGRRPRPRLQGTGPPRAEHRRADPAGRAETPPPPKWPHSPPPLMGGRSFALFL